MRKTTDKQEFSPFLKNKSFEVIIIACFIGGALLTIFFSLVKFTYFFLACVLYLLVNIILSGFLRGKNYQYKMLSPEEVIFKGGMRTLFLLLSEHNFVLKKQIAEFYVFQTDYKILPKDTLIVGQISDGFFIQGPHVAMEQIKKSVSFQELSPQNIIENDNAQKQSNNSGHNSNISIANKIN